MAKKKTVFTDVTYDGVEDGITFIPQNRTLYADQFTPEGPFSDEDRTPFKPKNMREVFEHYQPKISVELKDEKGDHITEDFVFSDLMDFDDERLIAQSKVLSEEYDRLNSSEVNNQEDGEDISHNLQLVREKLINLEKSYRTLSSFFDNAGQGNIDYITLMNVNRHEFNELNVFDSDDSRALCDELERCYDHLSLKNNYSLFVLPGYLGDAVAVREWAKTAFRNKVILITDYKDCHDFSKLREELEDANLQGQYAYLGNAVMTCNYLLGRRKSEKAGENEDLYIPGSVALAGRMSNTMEMIIAQGAYGKEHGKIDNVYGIRMKLNNSEATALSDLGVIPMVEEEGRVIVFSDHTLYNGATIGLQEYPIVRVFDWIGKVFYHFLNDEVFRNWDAKTKNEVERALHDFLSENKGPGELIESYSQLHVDQDPKTKDITVHVAMKPTSSAIWYVFKVKGHRSSECEVGYSHYLTIKD